MKHTMVFLAIMATMFVSVCTKKANAQIGGIFEQSQRERCALNLAQGVLNPPSCMAAELSRMTNITAMTRAQILDQQSYFDTGGLYGNRFGGGFLGGDLLGDYYGSQYGRGHLWAPVVAAGIQTGGAIAITKMGLNAAERMESQRSRLEEKRIDLDEKVVDYKQEVILRGEDRTDATLQMELRQSEGRYTYEMATISQPTTPVRVQVRPQKTGRILHNQSSCRVGVFQNNRRVFTLSPNGLVSIFDDGYSLEADDGCSIQVNNQGDEIVISPGR